jgi:hypothetical protein
MQGKQIIVDIVVVIVLPLLFLGGYYSLKSDDGVFLSLTEPTVAVQPGEEGQELGAKTATALVLLRSIPPELDQSLFNDPAYLMLRDYRVTIPTIPLGRANPFTPPPVLESLSRFSRSADALPVVVAPTAASSAKAAALKGSVTK